MMKRKKTYDELLKDFDDLQARYLEASETLNAIRTGQVDALVVQAEHGHQIYTLKGADHAYRIFIEKMKEGAVTLNKEGIILYSNSQFASMVDLPISEVIGFSMTQFIPEGCSKAFAKLMKNGWKVDTKGELLLKNNKDRIISVLMSFTCLELDEGISLSVILTDLSLQKEVENLLKLKNEQLEEARARVAKMNEDLEDKVKERTKDLLVSREYFKFLADNIPVIIWTADMHGRLDYINRQWFEYTGYDLEESRTKQQELIHPEDLEFSSAAWRYALKQKQPYEQEFRFKRSFDGVFRWHYSKAIPFQDEQGNTAAWIGISIDIDDQRKQLEKKDEFISVASHELKTPLTSLKGYMQLIEYENHLTGNSKTYVSKANISIDKLHHLVDELLDASRITAGKLVFSRQIFNLTNLVAQCIESSNFIYRTYKIEQELQPDIFVNGNEERIEQVVMNLINNAVKYSPDNKEIIVRATVDQRNAIVSVVDSGIGLSEADQKLVFQRFYRVNGNKYYASGLGMGLYIASEIIKEHNGGINIKSKLNQGSEFSFTLPLAEMGYSDI